MLAVVGLGNPGPEYADTRHNIGFAVVERLAERWGATFASDVCANVAHAEFGGRRVALVEPQLLMNRSGPALARTTLLPALDGLLVVHDDLDLACGRVQVKRGGGAAGHRGVESIAQLFGTDFPRVRVGIGRPPVGVATREYVLESLATAEIAVLAPAVSTAADAVESVLRDGAQIAMNVFNARQRRPMADPLLRDREDPDA